MKIAIYILSFLFVFGSAITVRKSTENCPMKSSQTCLAEQEKKGCCDGDSTTVECQCCKIIATLKAEEFRHSIPETVEVEQLKGEAGSLFNYLSKHFHPPQFV